MLADAAGAAYPRAADGTSDPWHAATSRTPAGYGLVANGAGRALRLSVRSGPASIGVSPPGAGRRLAPLGGGERRHGDERVRLHGLGCSRRDHEALCVAALRIDDTAGDGGLERRQLRARLAARHRRRGSGASLRRMRSSLRTPESTRTTWLWAASSRALDTTNDCAGAGLAASTSNAQQVRVRRMTRCIPGGTTAPDSSNTTAGRGACAGLCGVHGAIWRPARRPTTPS